MKKLTYLLALLCAACGVPTIETRDLSRSCATDSECRVALDVPCVAGSCPRCEGIPVDVEGLEEYNARLEIANAQCFSEGICSECATDSIRRAPRCEQGTCVVVDGE